MSNRIITHNISQNRFETHVGEEVAHIDYIRKNNVMALVHTFVPHAHRNNGIGFALVRFALEYAKHEQLKIIPGCSSVQLFMERHPAYDELIA
ncbi:MAG: GNAT family N-acetyltransferase [bacterium]